MFVFMLIASGLLISGGLFLIFTGDYIATLDIAATLVSAGVLTLALALLTRTIAGLPEHFARHAARLAKAQPTDLSPAVNTQPAPPSDQQADISSITKAIAKATTPPQNTFNFPEPSAYPAPPAPEKDTKPQVLKETKLPPLPSRPAVPTPATSPFSLRNAPEPRKPEPTKFPPIPTSETPVSSAPPERTPPTIMDTLQEPKPLEAPVPTRTVPRPIIPPLASLAPAPENTPHHDEPAPALAPSHTDDLANDVEPDREFLKEGNIDGVIYRFYSDGSAETDTPEGTRYFASIEEVRNSILLSRVSLDLEADAPHDPSPAISADAPEAAAPSAQAEVSRSPASSLWPEAPTDAGNPSPFDFSPSRYATPEKKHQDSTQDPHSSPSEDAQHAGNTSLDTDEWAEPFRMLLRKDKNSQT